MTSASALDTENPTPEDTTEPGEDSRVGELRWLPTASLTPHPDNPRSDLGDTAELVRSVRAQGVLEPLLVLPADEDGVHLIVAGHRRHHAALKAEVAEVPAVVRDMPPAEVIEAMLSENVNRDALEVSDEVRAIERLMSLDEGLTPAKLCRRIGKSRAWVRSRMAVTVLPVEWRDRIGQGRFTLAAAEAAASAADLGPDHVEAICQDLASGFVHDAARTVEGYRRRLRQAERYEQALAKERRKGNALVESEDELPKGAKALSYLFDEAGRKRHESESCHVVVLRRDAWGDGVTRTEMCTKPNRHSSRSVQSGKGSALEATWQPRRADPESSHAKRKGRLARLGHATEVWARTRSGISQTRLIQVAHRALVLAAGYEALRYAATILGYDSPKDVTAEMLLAGANTPAKLARAAGAVACGIAESWMYNWATGPVGSDYLELLLDSGWEPDDWTAQRVARSRSTDQPHGPGNEAQASIQGELPDGDVAEEVDRDQDRDSDATDDGDPDRHRDEASHQDSESADAPGDPDAPEIAATDTTPVA